MDLCPWCEHGNYALTSMQLVPCGFCRGTGAGVAWRQHPEYTRQLADERLKKFTVPVEAQSEPTRSKPTR